MRALFIAGLLALTAALPAHAEEGPAALEAALDARLAAFSGTAGLVIYDPVTDRVLYSRDADRPFVAASLYKLALLVEAEARIESDELAYTDDITVGWEDITADGSFVPPGAVLSVDEALESMITLSDNGSALALGRLLGPDAVRATLARHGITGFDFARDTEDDHVVTARAVSELFRQMAMGHLVSRAASARMIARLERQQVNDRLPARIEGVRIAHKTGNLGWATHDAGILWTAAGRPVVVSALTEGSGEDEAVALLADIGRLVHRSPLWPRLGAEQRTTLTRVRAEAGALVLIPVRVRNPGAHSWAEADGARLRWDIVDRSGTVVAAGEHRRLLALGVEESATLVLEVIVPERPGAYRLRFGVASLAFAAPSPADMGSLRIEAVRATPTGTLAMLTP